MEIALNKISLPSLQDVNFGQALAEQFANININFQKISNLGLGRGVAGKPSKYILYNLNAVFVYSTGVENSAEYNVWKSFHDSILDGSLGNDVLQRMTTISQEVEADYQTYYDLTGLPKEVYAKECAGLIWGNDLVYTSNTISSGSMVDTLYHSKEDEALMTPIAGFRAIWLRDWYISKDSSIFSQHILSYDPGRITIACNVNDDGSLTRIGSLSYVYVDPRFRNSQATSLAGMISTGESSGQSVFEDISCTLYLTSTGIFEYINLFPQIYFDGEGFFWKINNHNTRIPVTGSQGLPGKSSQFVMVERVENRKGCTPDKPAGTGDWLADGEEGWLNGVDVKMDPAYLFRAYRIVGEEYFWKANSSTSKDPYRPLDPTFGEYNYGNLTSVTIDDTDSIQTLINSLDECPCIVVSGPAYQPGRSNTTVWFSMLHAVAYSNDPGNTLKQLVIYCSDENEFTTRMDDNALAELMQRLDPYSFKPNGGNDIKPRGLVLPIGSFAVDGSTDWSTEWGSHLLHSDLGGFENRGEEDGYRYGIQKSITDGNSRTAVQVDVPAGESLDIDEFTSSQFKEVISKNILHIGSVHDLRTLSYTDGILGPTDNYNAAVPGRKRGIGVDSASSYGTPGFWGKEGKYNARSSWNWFFGSELHIDEPVTITRYRDLERRKHLLNVEGDVTIGLDKHVNAPTLRHPYRGGGLYIKSTLSQELEDKVKYVFPRNSIFPDDFFGKIQLAQPITTSANIRRVLGTLSGSSGQDSLYDPGSIGTNDHLFGLLVEDTIGARMLTAIEGITVIRKNSPSGTRYNTVFHVDADGNAQVKGKLTVGNQGVEIKNGGLTVAGGGADITGETKSSAKLTVASGGADITGETKSSAKLTVASGGADITGDTTSDKFIRRDVSAGLLMSNGFSTREIPFELYLGPDKITPTVEDNEDQTLYYKAVIPCRFSDVIFGGDVQDSGEGYMMNYYPTRIRVDYSIDIDGKITAKLQGIIRVDFNGSLMFKQVTIPIYRRDMFGLFYVDSGMTLSKASLYYKQSNIVGEEQKMGAQVGLQKGVFNITVPGLTVSMQVKYAYIKFELESTGLFAGPAPDSGLNYTTLPEAYQIKE